MTSEMSEFVHTEAGDWRDLGNKVLSDGLLV